MTLSATARLSGYSVTLFYISQNGHGSSVEKRSSQCTSTHSPFPQAEAEAREFYARRKSWVKKFAYPENRSNARCSQLASGDERPNADRCRKGAHPAPALLFLLGSVVLSLLLPGVIFRVFFSFGSTSQRVRYWGVKGFGSLLD